MHGLNWYDFEARYYDATFPVLLTMDPKAENFYSWSPYVYCLNNPMKYIDPDGKQARALTATRTARQAYSIYKLLRYAGAGGVIAGGTYIGAKEVEKRSEEVSNHLINNYLETSGGKAWQDKQDQKAKEALDQAQANVSSAIKENMPDGSGDNKGGKIKGGVIGGAAVIAGGVTRIIMEGTSPDGSKDAAEAHQEKAEEKQKQVPQDPPREKSLIERVINWLNN